MTLNENLANDLSRLVREEADLRQENASVIKANSELFNETQRLSDEEAKWAEERAAFERDIGGLRNQISGIESKVAESIGAEEMNSEALEGLIQRITDEKKVQAEEFTRERRAFREASKKMEVEINTLVAQMKGEQKD